MPICLSLLFLQRIQGRYAINFQRRLPRGKYPLCRDFAFSLLSVLTHFVLKAPFLCILLFSCSFILLSLYSFSLHSVGSLLAQLKYRDVFCDALHVSRHKRKLIKRKKLHISPDTRIIAMRCAMYRANCPCTKDARPPLCSSTYRM